MRIVQLTPGTGHFYCGNCLRDSSLAISLRKLGHDVSMVPLYLPVFTEDAGEPGGSRVFLGGINAYLQHKFPPWGKLPQLLTRPLDSPRLLRWSSKQGDMTDAAKHADMTLAMLRGEDDGQRSQIERLLAWMKDNERPDVVCLCNALLVGLARPIKRELGVPVVATLHGEDGFLDALPPEKSREAWETLRDRAADVDAFVAVSRYYGELMQPRMGFDDAKLHVVHNGIPLEDIPPPHEKSGARTPTTNLTIGYLARMCPDKGLHTLVDAFIELKRRGTIDGLRLQAAGVALKADRKYIAGLKSKLEAAGVAKDATFQTNITREEKLEFLRGLTVLSTPATCGEAFGLYVLEALAHGVPVVQPNHGAFPEILERTGGGLLCRPDDPASLAGGLERVLTDGELRTRLSRDGREAVLSRYSAQRMARDVADVYTLAARGERGGARVASGALAT